MTYDYRHQCSSHHRHHQHRPPCADLCETPTRRPFSRVTFLCLSVDWCPPRAVTVPPPCHLPLFVCRLVSAAPSPLPPSSLQVWNTSTCEFVRTLSGHKRGIACLQYRDRLVVSGSSDNTIRWARVCRLAWPPTVRTACGDSGGVGVTAGFRSAGPEWGRRELHPVQCWGKYAALATKLQR